jgi:hypothetical protein
MLGIRKVVSFFARALEPPNHADFATIFMLPRRAE